MSSRQSEHCHDVVARRGTLRAGQAIGRRSRKAVVGVCIGTLFLCTTAFACQVPVFRYGLERWLADRYQIVVLHNKQLTDEQKAALNSLRKAAERNPDLPAALDIELVDINNKGILTPLLAEAWANNKDTDKPLLLASYPRANKVEHNAPTWTGELNGGSVKQLLNSPARQELTERLQRGDSAVWLFVPSGNKERDKAAKQRLNEQLTADAKWLKLPSPEELEVTPDVLSKVKVPLQIRFSVLDVRRDDPAEQFLLASLINSEDDLVEFADQPLAFPVFGRGRVLYALVGKGIASDTIRAASSFVAGPCSCQVKNQNPGFDLLLQANWKKALGDVLISEPIETVDTEANAPKLLTIPPGRNKK